MKNNIKMTYPSYLKDFKCIGGKCESSCCGGWEIYIDKNVFELYKQIENEEMKKYINENIFVRDKCKNINVDYGQIKFKQNEICPFLNEEKYCSIQLNFGEEYLSNVCANFPRVVNKINDCFEISLDVSCIEAAKILLLKEEGIIFFENDYALSKHILTFDINTKDKLFEYTNIKYIKEIRNICISLIKNRKYELSERLYMLGSFLELTRKELCYNYDAFLNFANNYNLDSFSGEFQRDKLNYLLQLSFYKDILKKLNPEKNYIDNYFRKIIQETKIALRFNEKESLIENSELYLKAYNKCEKIFFHEYSYIFENYLVNHIFKELFPFSDSDIIINDLILLLFRYSFIRVVLIGQYIYKKELSKENIVRVIQVFSKEIEHNEEYLKEIVKHIKENELDNMKFAKILI